MSLRRMGISLGFFLLAGGLAQAQTRDENFNSWDQNRNGVLDRGEWTGHPGNFKGMDCNADGVLTREEFVNRYRCDQQSAAPPAMVRQHDDFSRLDRDDDGVVERHEWNGNAEKFRVFDRNNDGVVSRDEWSKPLDENSTEGRFQQQDRNNDGVLSRGEWKGDRGSFDRMDRNKNGVVTLNEYGNTGVTDGRDGRDGRFNELDRNNDGVLNRGEWVSGREGGRFQEVDRNNDGRVTVREYLDRPAARVGDGRFDTRDRSAMAGRFGEMDTNDDGILSRWEWRGDAQFFDQLDRNRDARVTRDEFLAQ